MLNSSKFLISSYGDSNNYKVITNKPQSNPSNIKTNEENVAISELSTLISGNTKEKRIFSFDTEIINKVLEKYSNVIKDNNYEYKIFYIFTNLEQTEENFSLFIDFFEKLNNEEIFLEDIKEYLLNNNLEFSINSIKEFLEDFNELEKNKLKNELKNLIFYSFKKDNSNFFNFFQSIYDGTIDDEFQYLSNYIFRNDLPFNSDIANRQYQWLIEEDFSEYKISLLSTNEKRYNEKIISAFNNNDFNDFLEYEFRISSLWKVLDDLKYIKENTLNWFLIERKSPLFLKKLTEKMFFSSRKDLDETIFFSLTRVLKNEDQNRLLITKEEFLRTFDIFLSYFSSFLFENKIAAEDFVENISNFLEDKKPYDLENEITDIDALKYYLIIFFILIFFNKENTLKDSLKIKIDSAVNELIFFKENIGRLINIIKG